MTIDLSSDTAARPTESMKYFMWSAPLGDDQRGEDPTVRELESIVAELTRKDDAVFLPSGTMCNIVAFFVHCSPGDEVILHREAHPVTSEGAGPAVHSRVSLCCLDGERGIFTGAQVAEAFEREGSKRPRPRLVSVENTHNRGGGSVWKIQEVQDVCETASALGLSSQLDGARLLNAVVSSGIPAHRYTAPFDSVWLDLSKGLGCPVGAVLAGSASFVDEARRAKQLFGGAMHQAGIVAAAGVYALRHHIDRLADDHALAQQLAEGLEETPGIRVLTQTPETNIVHFQPESTDTAVFERVLRKYGIRFGYVNRHTLRAVTHLDIAPENIASVLDAVREAVDQQSVRPA